ncbi:ligand-binding protein SH3 [Sulfuricaulis limicola]|uniref:Ligand-binding protein SH3 n=1 Tax=Sulfuricaulis limicola TaxID=1620215 RepID=A0A1B4XC20_9GAMM|nr:SH3 domain-containing protein [Sulfuricaulis limicola]BAV32343.1 ligand-binding protein SH3 [Sulfuricaulis limicola]
MITLISLLGLASLGAACGQESGGGKTAGTTATESRTIETATVATNAATAAKQPAAAKSTAAVRETGATRAAVTLMATPYSDAKPAGQLAANTTVDILERRGGWLRISAKGASGWAKLHQVRVGEGPEATKSGEGLAILKNVGETGRSGSTGIVATTGIRGLSAEGLKNAKPDPAAVKAIEHYRVTAAQAREYAKSAGLKEASVPALPKPE